MSQPVRRPSIGVVIPAYNAEGFLEETLTSLLDQSYPWWQAVVVDDGSTDSTAVVAKELADQDDRLHLEQQANAGECGARNKALRLLGDSGVRYIACLDSDDVLLPEAFSLLVAALEARPDAAAAYGLAEYMDESGEPISPGTHSAMQQNRRSFQAPGPGPGPAHLGATVRRALTPVLGRRLEPAEDTGFDTLAIYGSIWPPATALVRSEVVHEVGGFDPAFSYMGDWDFFLRVARHGPLVMVDRQVAWYRRHQGNSGVSGASYASPLGHWDASFWAAIGAVRRKAWESPDNTPGQRVAVCRANRRDGLALVKREAAGLVSDLRAGAWPEVRGHMAWAGYGLWLAAQPHPPEVGPVLQTVKRVEGRRPGPRSPATPG